MRGVNPDSSGETQQRLFAVRGATQVDANEAETILDATEELMRELIERNSLEPEAMVSCLFTTTEDLDAEFPAVAARRLGLSAVPLLCCREIPVPGSMPRVIRVMAHYYAPVDHVATHAYLGGAGKLRAYAATWGGGSGCFRIATIDPSAPPSGTIFRSQLGL